MFLKLKPLLFLQVLDKSIRYLAIHAKNHSILDKGEIIFDVSILEDGRLINESLLKTRLDALVKEKKWEKAKTYILLLNDFLVIREEKVPIQLTTKEVKDYLGLHMNQAIRMPINYPKFDFGIIDKNENEQRVFIAAYPTEIVDQYQELLQNVSLRPIVADISALSLYRIAYSGGIIQKNKSKHIILLEWNPYDISITVFNKNCPTFNRYSRSLRFSNAWEFTPKGEWVWKESNLELETMIEDQLNNLERFLDFYRYSVLNGEEGISEIILTGNYPNLNFLKTRLQERFLIEIHMLKLPKGIDQYFGPLYGLTLRDEIGGRE